MLFNVVDILHSVILILLLHGLTVKTNSSLPYPRDTPMIRYIGICTAVKGAFSLEFCMEIIEFGLEYGIIYYISNSPQPKYCA